VRAGEGGKHKDTKAARRPRGAGRTLRPLSSAEVAAGLLQGGAGSWVEAGKARKHQMPEDRASTISPGHHGH
jgi:hypothetical protein